MGIIGVVALSMTGVADVRTFTGSSDASAAVMLDARHFVVADDENNTLRIYAIDGPSGPVGQVELDLCIEPDHPEADIEGAARVADRIYWITSHGRNKNGKERPNRYAFFATDIVSDGRGVPTIKPVGRPYRRLAYDVMLNQRLRFLGLDKTIRLAEPLTKSQREALAPKENGLNIEGLAAGPNGSLLVGLRNPHYLDPVREKEMAILLVLENPDEMVIRGTPARFGEPILLDADGLGIRSIEEMVSESGQRRYLIAAGTINGTNRFAFYTWDGGDGPLHAWGIELPDAFTPEAMFQVYGTNAVWILSDDGTIEKEVSSADECVEGELLKNGRCPNKFLIDAEQRTFRAITVTRQTIEP